MKRILIIAGAIVGVLVIALFTLPYLVPTSVYKTQIENGASNALGRDVSLAGDPRLSILPSISARIDGAQVSNPEGFSDPMMIEAGSLRAKVKLWPLLMRRVEISEIILEDATVRLERLEDGRVNWTFGTGESAPEDTETPEDGSSSSGFNTGIDRARLSNAAVFYSDQQTGTQYALTDFNARARLKALDAPLTSSGDGQINGQAFAYDVRLDSIEAVTSGNPAMLDLDLTTDLGRVIYDGELTLGTEPAAKGAFEISSDALGAILAFVDLEDIPFQTDTLRSIKLEGGVSGPMTQMQLAIQEARLRGEDLDVAYAGAITLGETPQIDGRFSFDASDAVQLFKPDFDLIGPLSLLGDVELSAAISGPLTSPSLQDIVIKQRSDMLALDFTGALSLAGDQPLSGEIEVRSDNLRAALSALDVSLPEGETLQDVSVKGAVTGALLAPTLSGATLRLDETTATGAVGADLRGATPRVNADLSLPRLDLTPFLGSSEPSADTSPSLDEDWDDTPLALDGLKAVDATLTLNADEVILDQITLTDALLTSRLDDGILSAVFRRDTTAPGFRAFGGNWSGDLELNAARSTPTLEVNALADSIASQEMLGALTGYTGLIGLGDVQLALQSEGASLKGLIEGLDGNFESSLADGKLQGINLAKLVRDVSNVQGLLSSGDLTPASFREALSPEAETDFSSFIGNLTFTNGVAEITDLELENPVVGVSGSGQINLAARTLDINLVPTFDLSAQGGGSTIGVDSIPIPVRVYGSWTGVQFGFDTGAIQRELTARARGSVADTIRDEIGGDVGNILGEIVGGGSTSSDEDPEEPRTDLRSRALGGILGSVLGDDDEDEDDSDDN